MYLTGVSNIRDVIPHPRTVATRTSDLDFVATTPPEAIAGFRGRLNKTGPRTGGLLRRS